MGPVMDFLPLSHFRMMLTVGILCRSFQAPVVAYIPDMSRNFTGFQLLDLARIRLELTIDIMKSDLHEIVGKFGMMVDIDSCSVDQYPCTVGTIKIKLSLDCFLNFPDSGEGLFGVDLDEGANIFGRIAGHDRTFFKRWNKWPGPQRAR